MQFLDSVFHVPTPAVDRVDTLGLESKVCNDVLVVIAGGSIRETDDFSFDDQTTGLQPGLGLIADVREERFSLAGAGRQDPNCPHERLDLGFEGRISREAYLVLGPFLFQVIEDGRRCESAVEANSKPRFGKCPPQPGDNPHQDSDRSAGTGCITRMEDDGEQKLLPFVVELKSPELLT